MAVLLFPGQGSQHIGMGKDLYNESESCQNWFHEANDILGYNISDVMFEGTEEDLKQTKITQPAVFLNSIIRYFLHQDTVVATAVGGHSLGELTALVANNVLSFNDGLLLVQKRALAMQQSCDNTDGTMAAILGLENSVVEDICNNIGPDVVAANYNCPGQLVISGTVNGIQTAVEAAKEKGARRALVLNVNGAFHSPLMNSAKVMLEEAIEHTAFSTPTTPIYQNVTAKATSDIETIKSNLIKQLTAPVKWTQTMQNMVNDGHKEYVEFGAKVLSGFLRRVDRTLEVSQL